MVANFTVKLITKTPEIKQKIVNACYEDIIKKISNPSLVSRIREGVEGILEEALISQKEYAEMVDNDGILRGELGVVDSKSAMDSLIEDWVKTVRVMVKRPIIVGNTLKGAILSITAIYANYEDVLDKIYASYVTEKGVVINWLDWLLTKGQKILVQKHISVYRSVGFKTSRTGNTIMRKSKGRGWGVPMIFSGTLNNNFCTRAIDSAIPKIESLIVTEINREFT